MQLPVAGLASNQPALRVRIRGSSTALDAAVLISPAVVVGTLESTSLAYSPAIPGEASALTLAFDYSEGLAANDVITVVLPGFTGSSKPGNLALGGANADDFDGGGSAWDAATTTLTLIVGQGGVERGAGETAISLAVDVAVSNGVTLPAGGLAANQPTLTLRIGGSSTAFEVAVATSPAVLVGSVQVRAGVVIACACCGRWGATCAL